MLIMRDSPALPVTKVSRSPYSDSSINCEMVMDAMANVADITPLVGGPFRCLLHRYGPVPLLRHSRREDQRSACLRRRCLPRLQRYFAAGADSCFVYSERARCNGERSHAAVGSGGRSIVFGSGPGCEGAWTQRT